MSRTTNEKNVFWLLVIGLILHIIAGQYIVKNSSGYYEGPGVLFGFIGAIIWIVGMIKYARSKGRSDFLAIFLSALWVPGLIILILLRDLKKPAKNKSIKNK